MIALGSAQSCVSSSMESHRASPEVVEQSVPTAQTDISQPHDISWEEASWEEPIKISVSEGAIVKRRPYNRNLDSFEMAESPPPRLRAYQDRTAPFPAKTNLGSEVAFEIRARVRRMQRCYENSLRANAQLSGRVAAEITIKEDGTVSPRITFDSVGDQALARCLEAVFSDMRFRRPDGGSVTFTYPLSFHR